MLKNDKAIRLQCVGLLALLCFGFSSPVAQAELFTCEVAGKKVFQDKPCKRNKAEQKQDSNSPARVGVIHASWFAKPDHFPGNFTCAESGCMCGTNEKNKVVYYHRKKNDKFLFPLRTLTSSWRSLQGGKKQLNRNTTNRQDKLSRLQRHACEIRIKQEIIRSLYNEYTDRIKQDYVAAQDKLERNDSKCVRPVANHTVTDAEAVAWLECSTGQRVHQRNAKNGLNRAESNVEEMNRLLKQLAIPLN